MIGYEVAREIATRRVDIITSASEWSNAWAFWGHREGTVLEPGVVYMGGPDVQGVVVLKEDGQPMSMMEYVAQGGGEYIRDIDADG